MIDKEYGLFYIVCDVCGKTSESFDTFQEAADSKEEQGFLSQRQYGEWKDVCSNCFKAK